MRRRLGELGLEFAVITVPRKRAERTQVLEVSGQALVPTLIAGDKMFVDENDILSYLDETYGRAPATPDPLWPEDPEELLQKISNDAREGAALLLRIAQAAKDRGLTDAANILKTAADSAQEVAGWVDGMGEDLK